MSTILSVAVIIVTCVELYTKCDSVTQQKIVLAMYDVSITLLLLYTYFEYNVTSYL